MAKAKAKVLTRLRIDEVSSVDRGAGEGVKITLMKRDKSKPKTEVVMSTVGKFFTDLFKSKDAPVKDRLRKATAALAESVASITQSEAEDRGALLAKTFAQYQDHIDSLSVEKTERTNEGEDKMLAILRKSLGLKEDASEDEIHKAIEANNKAVVEARAAVEKAKADLDEDEEKEDADEKDEDKKKAFRAMSHAQRKEYMRKKHSTELPSYVQEIMKRAEEDRKQLAKLTDERELEAIKKIAVDAGMADGEAETVQKAYKGDKAAVDKLVANVKAANTQARAAGVFKEIGSTGGDRVGSTAMDLLNAKAAEYRKAHPDLSEQQAFSKVYQDPANAKLVQQERAENRPAA